MEKQQNSHRYLHLHGMINLNYQMDLIPYHIFKIIWSIFKKKHGEDTDKPSVQIYVNKIESRATSKIKNGYSL